MHPCRRRFLQLAAAATLGMAVAPRPARAAPGTRQGGGSARPSGESALLTLFLAGDVMIGRGIDQVLPHPGDPKIYESDLRWATDYVTLAETAHGPIPKPVDFPYVWGDALGELARCRPDARIVNLETAVTKSATPAPKAVDYKASPENFPVITAAKIDCCALANNHVLDWGEPGLIETLETLDKAGVKHAGAGRDLREAAAPAILPVPGKGRVLVFAFGSTTSGIPSDWAATDERPGVDLLPGLSPQTAHAIGAQVRAVKKPGDVAVASIHWGANWGYAISDRQVAFAHALIDEAGIDVVYGHSSHHPKAIEVYRGKPILYGCGDFLDDYEGITGYEEYRDDLVLMYFPVLRPSDGALAALTMVPLQSRKFRLHHASPADAAWLRDTLSREGERFKTHVRLNEDNSLTLEWR